MLMLAFALWLGWFPAIGAGTAAHFVLPVTTLGLQSAGHIARMTRAAMLDVLGEEYLRAARAKGVSAAQPASGLKRSPNLDSSDSISARNFPAPAERK